MAEATEKPKRPDYLAYAKIGRDVGFMADYKMHLPTVLDALLRLARTQGIEVNEGWTIAKLREELAARVEGDQ